MPRSKKQPILYQEKLNIPEEFLRFATSKEVALYRAERLKCNTLVEIGAGIGGQTLAFAKFCKKVIAIEINKKYADILINNLKKLKIDNVKIIIGNALNQTIIEQIKQATPDIIFCDTERKAEGERSINDLQPNILKLLDAYSKITKNIAVEIPPFTKDIDSLKEFEFEKEFLSLNGKLNRLTLYFGSLKKCDVSVVALPEKERIEKSPLEEPSLKKSPLGKPSGKDEKNPREENSGKNKKIKSIKEIKSLIGFEYLYEINPAIILAGLVNELALSLKFSQYVNLSNKQYLISNQLINSQFLQPYKILSLCENNFKEILLNLKNLNAGKVSLRYNINPNDYWRVRNSYENSLKENKSGKEIHLFIDEKNEKAILCEKI